MSERYLTDDEKVRELAGFERYKAIPGIWRRDHPDDRGGRGRVDHEVLPLVDDLNALDGVCTIQSCCGHRWPLNDGHGGECVYRGQLWLRLSEEVMGAVQERVGDLLAHDVIVHVTRLYSFQEGTEPHDVLDVMWHEDRMNEAHEVIADFFRSIVTISWAPWTDVEVEAIRAWQANERFHGLTCETHSNDLLTVETDGLSC